MVWLGWVQATEELYRGTEGSRNLETELVSRSVLHPGHLGKGGDETFELEESSPTGGAPLGGSVEVLRQVPRRHLGGVIQVSASSHRVRCPPPKRMSLLNPWTWG